MKKHITFLCSLTLMVVAPLIAQDGPMTAPPALDNEFLSFLEGEWVGSTESPMGKSTDWTKYEMALSNQYLTMQGTYKFDAGMNYEGMGYLTLTPEGAVTGGWLDNFRGNYSGSGTIEGTKLTVNWEGGGMKSTRITEKTGDDQITIISKQETPQGAMESKGVYTRKK
ncbi:MAG: hypothetical protein ACR2MX_03575 [Cyclobacteriaceae bacterium]